MILFSSMLCGRSYFGADMKNTNTGRADVYATHIGADRHAQRH